MQVSQMSDAVTHAVLGKKNSVEMGVSDSAALMHIFSTTLYTYPKLATVREIICNGWDGHIVVGKTDTPLQITVNEDFISIRDFGPGIPDDKIGPIYGVFGNSTKRDDNTVTGGFGLGSKAPFAYTDNFEVTSHHGGLKSVYRISKSSMERGGKPTIDTMVQIPSDETGIQVKIQLKTGLDQHDFMRLITEVLVLGEIKASINGNDPVVTLPLSESHTGYIINSFAGTLTSKINLRYGNVVYPIPRNEFYAEMWDQVHNVMRKLWIGAQITFMAPPDTVTIAPSREALIFTEGTEETIKNLLMNFKPDQAKTSVQTSVQVTRTQVNKLIQEREGATQSLDLRRMLHLPAIEGCRMDHANGPYAFEVRKAALNHMLSSRSLLVKGEDFLTKNIKHAVFKGTVDKTLGNRFLRAIKKYGAAMERGTWGVRKTAEGILRAALHKEVTLPLLNAVKESPFMEEPLLTYAYQKYCNNSMPTFVTPHRFVVGEPINLAGFLFKRVLLARSKKAINDFFENLRNKAYTNSSEDCRFAGWVVYQLPKSDKNYAEIQKVFENLGYEVTTYLPVKAAKVVSENDPQKPLAPRKPSVKRKGYLSLESSLNREGNFLLSYARDNCRPEDHILKPVAYVVLNNASQNSDRFAGLRPATCFSVNKLLGKKVAVVTKSQAEILKEKGIPDVNAYINSYVDDALASKKDFPRYLAFGRHFGSNINPRHNSLGVKGVIRQMLNHDVLMQKLGKKLRFGVSEETELLITFFEDDSFHGTSKHMTKCHLLATKVEKSPLVHELPEKMRKSPWAQYVDMEKIGTALFTKQPGDEALAVPYEIIEKLIE